MPRSRSPRPKIRARSVERLECRRLFAGISFGHHTLTIGGSHTAPDTITFGLNAGDTAVVATLSFPTKTGTATYTKSVPLSSKITLINVMGGNGADLVTVDQTYGSFAIRTSINTGAGNDTVLAGDEPDRINGGAGNDSISGGGGNNTIYGGTGNDTITDGNGNDYLNGGVGHDVITAGNGTDTLADAVGPDTLLGGTGHDTFVVANLNRDVNNYDKTKDRLIIVNPNTNSNDNTSLLSSLFPITSLL